MKNKIITIITILFSMLSMVKSYAQDCKCPPLKLYVYDTKIDFNIDSYMKSASEAGKYVEAQNSGDWLEGAYLKQQSDEFKVYKGIKPNGETGTTYEQPPSDGGNPGNDIDFTSYAEVSRSGDSTQYSYTIKVIISDAYLGKLAASSIQVTNDLGKVDDLVGVCVEAMGSVLDKLREYQKQVRDQSNNTKWIYLRFQVIPEKPSLKVNDKTKVTIKLFDCADKKPAANQKLTIKQTTDGIGTIEPTSITTDENGQANITFTAKKLGQTEVYPDYTFTCVNGKSGYHVLPCGDQKQIIVSKQKYKITFEAEQTLPQAGMDIKLQGECFTTLKPLDDGTYMLEPVDKTRNMDITIKQNKLANAEGAVSQIISPQQYKFPFLFTIVNMDKNSKTGKATVYLNTTAPQTGTVKSESTADGKTVTTIADIDKGSVTTIAPNYTNTYTLPTRGMLYAMDAITHLNLLSGFASDINTTMQNVNQNIADANQKMVWAKRMMEHQNDPNYYKSAQGKKDMLMMQTLQKQLGSNIKYETKTTTDNRQEITKKMEKDPNYAGSAQFKKDLNKLDINRTIDESIYGNYAEAEVAPGTARLRITGNFNIGGSVVFSESRENDTGPMHTTLKIKVEKQ